jgi:hypothetical protein
VPLLVILKVIYIFLLFLAREYANALYLLMLYLAANESHVFTKEQRQTRQVRERLQYTKMTEEQRSTQRKPQNTSEACKQKTICCQMKRMHSVKSLSQ